MAMYIPFLHRGRIATALTALVPCAGGLLVLLGWTFDIERLKRIFLALVAMNPTAAVCFLFLGCAVLGSQAPAEERTLRRIAAFCAAAIGVIGILRLGDTFLDWSTGVDARLFASKLDDPASGFPNRIAPNTAVNFVLLSVALLLFNRRSRGAVLVSQICTLLSFVTSLIPVVGYAYGTMMVSGSIGLFVPMALPTALGFQAVCFSILFASPGRGLTVPLLDEGVSGVLTRRLLPTVIFLPIVIGWLRQQGQELDLYDPQLGLALTVVAHILLLGALVWGTSFELYRLDRRQKQAEAELQELTLTDELTGLRNRRGFLFLTEQEMKLARHSRMGIGLWLVYADLDGLKEINDRFGHAVGSRAIVQAAEVLKQTFRETDIIARLGGDEFGVLALSNDAEGGQILVERLQENLRAFNLRAGLPYRVSLSVGSVPLQGGSLTIEAALQSADLAMYEHKRARKAARSAGGSGLFSLQLQHAEASPVAERLEAT